MAITITNETLIQAAIDREVRVRVDAAIRGEIEASRDRVRKAIEAEADKIALHILRHYNVTANEHRTVIEVRKLVDDQDGGS
ncbi:MAG: hypothetical protein K5872_22045 [Rhizobiaceae bacterium]|nr:hypothetical protein [Rhizobiaceae bacterium]MCV0408902.1 hypothetical protein [Rhizobiaceae bacterium]